MRDPGHEPEGEAAEHEQRRVGQAQPSRDLEQDRDDDELDQEGGEDVHGSMMPGPTSAVDAGPRLGADLLARLLGVPALIRERRDEAVPLAGTVAMNRGRR